MSDTRVAGASEHARDAGAIQWWRSIAWLLFLGPFFFLSYGAANQWAAELEQVGSIRYDWERAIPFVPWTIVPYWSINLLYGLAFLFCRSARAVDRLAWRLLGVQVVSVACFVLFPLRFGGGQPEVIGVFAPLFDALDSMLGVMGRATVTVTVCGVSCRSGSSADSFWAVKI